MVEPRPFFAPAILLLVAVLSAVSVSERLEAQQTGDLNIRLVSEVKPSVSPLSYGDVWAENDIACLGVWLGYNTYGFGVSIFDVSNPEAPSLLSVYSPNPASQNQFELGVLRNRIGYFGSWSGGGLHIVSLTNPAAPVLLSRIGAATGDVTNGFDRVHTVFLERDYLYEAAHVPGILSVKVFDVSNPSAPVYLQDIYTTNTTKVHQITVRNKGGRVILYTSGWGGNNNGNPASPGQTDIWDVTEVGVAPAQWVGRIYSGYNSHSSWPTPDGNTLILCREIPGGDVRFYDVSNPAAIATNATPFVTLTPASMGLEADIPHNPVVVGNLLFLSWYQNGIQVFDIANPAKPVRLGFYDTFPGAKTSSYQGNWGVYPFLGLDRVLLSDIQRGMLVINATGVLAVTNNHPPLIVTPPASLTVTQGMNAVFSSVVTGSSLKYQWRFNGAELPGKTNDSLTFIDVQPADAGSYSFVVSNATAVITSSVANLTVLFPEVVETVFLEDFDLAASSNNWEVFEGSANGIPDFSVDWSFDYGAYFSDFNSAFIPPAPHTTNGTTHGLRLRVNHNDGIGSTAGVSLYPKGTSFSGAYRLKFDMWMNYPGGPGGGTGSTEHSTFGLNHMGTRVNWDSSTANPSDGVWFAVDGEGGTSTDYRAYEGNPAGSPTLLSFANSGFGASGALSFNNTDTRWQNIFPSPPYESPGAPGKQWVQVELGQDSNNVVSCWINGNLMAQRPNTSSFTNGTIMIGYMDLFASIASPAGDAFVVFDNVRLEKTSVAMVPVITAQPQGVEAYPDTDATFSVSVTGSEPLNFQWRLNGEDIPGATGSSYTRGGVQPEDVGRYSVAIANAAGLIVSDDAMLTLLDSPYLSGVAAAPGARSAVISWNTTVPADSQVQFDPATVVIGSPSSLAAMAQSSFGSSSYLDPRLTTNHFIVLTGLLPETLYSFQVLSSEGTNTYVSGVYQFTTAGNIILDNSDAEFSGSWNVGTSSPDKYSTNYAYATSVTGAATAQATWRPNPGTSGRYDVYVWYPEGGNRAIDAPYTIQFDGGSTNVLINQQSGGGKWQLIGAGIEFAKGTGGYVRLSNNAGPDVVMADAVRFSYVEDQDFPAGQSVPRWWSDAFFAGKIDAGIDHDGDHYTTSQEYEMGTVPTDPDSHLLMDVRGGSADGVITFWPYLGNRTYNFLSREGFGAGGWQPVAATITPTAEGWGRLTFSTANPAESYFRLRVEMIQESQFSGVLTVPADRAVSAFASDPICGPNRAYVVQP